MKLGIKTKERRFLNRRRKQGGLESAPPCSCIAAERNSLTDMNALQKVKFV